jgi:hypothetical protein
MEALVGAEMISYGHCSFVYYIPVTIGNKRNLPALGKSPTTVRFTAPLHGFDALRTGCEQPGSLRRH